MNTYLRCLLNFLIIMLTAMPAFSQAWLRITPTPQEQTILQIICIPGTEHVIAVCENSTIILSEDMGTTWEIVVNPGGQPNEFAFNGIYFIDDLTGFAFGEYETILKTTDGGHSWTTVLTGSEHNYFRVRDMVFINDSTGLATKTSDGFYYTSDRGDTWSFIPTPVYFDQCIIEFIDESEGIAIGFDPFECSYMRTTDGGLNWVLETPEGLSLQQAAYSNLRFVNDSTGFMFGLSGTLYKTTDRGHTWSVCYSDSFGGMDLEFLNEQQGMALFTGTSSCKVVTTNDSGNSWQEVDSLDGRAFNCAYINENSALIGGYKGLLLLTTGGLTQWERMDQRALSGNITKCQFVDNLTGYVESNNRLNKTTDGGTTWNLLPSPLTNLEVNDFHFISQDTGFVISHSHEGYFSTTDGGQTWNSNPDAFYTYPVSIEFYDKNQGLACAGYYVFYTNDGGENWAYVTPPQWNDGDVQDIEYLSENVIIISNGDLNSDYTSVYRSEDGGETWVMTLFALRGCVNRIVHYGEDTVYVACNTIFRSTDGGLTWTDLYVTGLERIRSLSFPTSDVGYAVGKDDYNSLLKTTDGGLTWNADNLYCTSALNDLYFTDDNNGFVFGNYGVQMKTTVGGSVKNKFVPFNAVNYFNIYPNPVSGSLTVAVTGKTENYESDLLITDISGRLVSKHKVIKSDHKLIDTHAMKAGLYFIQLLNPAGKVIQTRKLIKVD